MKITRRGFLGGLLALGGAVVVERTFPFRTYSFPEQIRPLNMPGSLFKIGDKFTTEVGVIYEVVEIGSIPQPNPFEEPRGYWNQPDVAYPQQRIRSPHTSMTEQEFSLIIKPTEQRYKKHIPPQKAWQRHMVERVQGDGYYGKRVFTLDRNGQQNRIYTRSYLPTQCKDEEICKVVEGVLFD